MGEDSRKPPVDIEQWMDFIIAAAAHRSHDECQRRFGELLIERYFVVLREDYKGDTVAGPYLDNMLCAVASAIRGFSVVRDIFGTRWDSLKELKDREKARAERIDRFAPFKADGFWKPAVATIALLGLATPLLASFQTAIGQLPWKITLTIASALIALLFVMELFVDWLRNRRLEKVEERYPETLLRDWQERSLKGYRTVLRQFLLLAIKIREEHYPNLPTLSGKSVYGRYSIPHIDCVGSGEIPPDEALEQQIADVVEQHFAFKSTTK